MYATTSSSLILCDHNNSFSKKWKWPTQYNYTPKALRVAKVSTMSSFVTMPDNEDDDQQLRREEDAEEDDLTHELSSANDDSVHSNDNDDLEPGIADASNVDVQFHGATELVNADEAAGDIGVSNSSFRSVEKSPIEERGMIVDEDDVTLPTMVDELPAAESGTLPVDVSLKEDSFPTVHESVPIDGVSVTPSRLNDEPPFNEQPGDVIVSNADHGSEASSEDRRLSEQGIAHVEANSRDGDEKILLALADDALNDDKVETIPQHSREPDSKPSPLNSIPLQDTKGAQILLSRFSSWRKKANEAVVQNVQAFSQTDIAHQLKTRAEVVKTRAEVAFRNAKVDTSDGKTVPKGEPVSISVGDQQHSQNNTTVQNAADVDGESRGNLSSSSEGSSSSAGSTSSAEVDLEFTASESKDPMPTEASITAVTAALYVRSAASVITDSVSSGFRGRYVEDAEPSPPKKEKPSQTSKIMSSRAAEHMQTIIDSLDDSHEYVMLLGQGMLGVNLRQAYLRNRGVYVDFLVEGGAAYNSSVVYAGDVIQKVGNISVAKGTILNVPKTVADAKRPAVLVFSTGQKVETSNVNYIDLAIAMMHQIKEDESRRGISKMPIFPSASDPPEVAKVDNGVEASDARAESGLSQLAHLDSVQHIVERALQPTHGSDNYQWRIPPLQLDAINPANIPLPPRAAKDALAAHLSKR